jgi:hypothetical protein
MILSANESIPDGRFLERTTIAAAASAVFSLCQAAAGSNCRVLAREEAL